MDPMQNRIARFKHPKQIFFIDELPRNSMGKVQKNVLRESYPQFSIIKQIRINLALS
ncbi:MAG: hypothetical protein Ct9H300mP28_09900 [Pseudomonadota bacterium]|nr:MAG: hypothetical protein Ct9H300mP28_09900 [Pseudomonadota bacterium]